MGKSKAVLKEESNIGDDSLLETLTDTISFRTEDLKMKAVTVTVLSLVLKIAALYDTPQNVPSRVIQLQGYDKIVGKEIKFILNCSSSETNFGDYTAEFLSNGNTINYIRYFLGICYKTVNISVCDSLICDCYVDNDMSWYSIAIEKPANSYQFSCLIREKKPSNDYVYALEGIWSENESISHVIQVAHTVSHPGQSFDVTNIKQEMMAIILAGTILLLLLILYMIHYFVKKRNLKIRQHTFMNLNIEERHRKLKSANQSTNGGGLGHRRKHSEPRNDKETI